MPFLFSLINILIIKSFFLLLILFRANDGNWTRDLFLTKETLYLWATSAVRYWARDGAQTRDPQLGRLTLYQLSYSRITTFMVLGEQDSNLWRLSQQIYSLPSLTAWVSPPEPIEGLEPTTCWLQISCSSQLSYIGLFCSPK